MRPVLSAEEMRAWDQRQIEAGVPGIVLMENAGRGAAHLIGLKVRPRVAGQAPHTGSAVAGTCVRCADERSLLGVQALIVCGPGNNGGDGFVVARHLASRGAVVRVWGWGDRQRLRGDAELACRSMEAVGIPWEPLPLAEAWGPALTQASVVVDALLGTGTQRPIEGTLREFVEALNASGAYVIALDVPTGLDATTGARLGVCVEAKHTITFGHLKQGLLTTEGHRCAGTVTLSHLGVPPTLGALQPNAWLLEERDVRGWLQPRSPVSHKRSSGRVVVVAGRPGTLGAARLSAHGALRGGAGVVTIATHAAAVALLDAEVREVMTHPLADDRASRQLLASADALVVGPGLGNDEASGELILLALRAQRPTVLDADALRWLANAGPSLGLPPGSLGGSDSLALCILTPHPGEAGALLGCGAAEIERDRFAAAQLIAERYGALVLLKGSRPVLARPQGSAVVSAFGSPALATAGSGDILCGLVAAQLVAATSSDELFELACCGLGLQGMAAERWAALHGDRGLLASEVADQVPALVSALLGP